MKKALPFDRWVHDQDIHITLAFLGGAAPDMLAAAVQNVQEAINDVPALPLKISKLGFFGYPVAPRVLWADTVESNELKTVRQKVYSACERAGFQLETRPFHPHITLARKWGGVDLFHKNLLEVWSELQPEPLYFQSRDVVLYQTHLNKTPKYEAIKVFSLQT